MSSCQQACVLFSMCVSCQVLFVIMRDQSLEEVPYLAASLFIEGPQNNINRDKKNKMPAQSVMQKVIND